MVSVSAAPSDLLAELGVARERIHLVANGVNTELFAPRDKGKRASRSGLPSAAVVTFVGRLEPQKGVGELLEAIPRVRARMRRRRLRVGGRGGVDRPREEEAAASNGAIVAPGARPLKEVAQLARRVRRVHAAELAGGDAERRARGAGERSTGRGDARSGGSRRAPRPSGRETGPRARRRLPGRRDRGHDRARAAGRALARPHASARAEIVERER